MTVGAPPPACTSPVVSIGSVQGTGDISPVAGQTVSVRGIVVGDDEGPQPALRGFYLQDAGDGDAATSDGIFVFNGGADPSPTATSCRSPARPPSSRARRSSAGRGTVVKSCGQQATVTPVDVTLPRRLGDASRAYEGMLVRLHQTLYVTEHFQLGRFGQVVVSSGGRLRQPTADIRAADQAAVQRALQAANELNRLIIDDADQAQNPDPIVFGRGGQPLSASQHAARRRHAHRRRRRADLHLGRQRRQRQRVPPASGRRPRRHGRVHSRPTPGRRRRLTSGPVRIKIASANLLNYFNTFDTDCTFGVGGGADRVPRRQRRRRVRAAAGQEVASLRVLDADVIGYMEMENDGYGPTSAVQALVDALNAADGPGTWAFVDPDAALGVVDVAGTDAIKAGRALPDGVGDARRRARRSSTRTPCSSADRWPRRSRPPPGPGSP